MVEIPSGWVKGNQHKRTDWHWWVGGEPAEGEVIALCGHRFSVMGKEGEVHGQLMRQDFPPAHFARPTCRACKRLMMSVSAEEGNV